MRGAALSTESIWCSYRFVILMVRIVTRPCVDCGKTLTAKNRGCLPNRCADCRKADNANRMRAWRAANPEKARRNSRKAPRTDQEKEARWVMELQQRYSLTLDDYRRLLERQNGVCAVCEGPPNGPGSAKGRFHVDHCHRTGKVRGLLCGKCNTAVGLLNDDAKRAMRVARYLEEA